MDYQRHGLKREMKRRVFDALLEMQQGKCFICGISQVELQGKVDAAPVHRTLHIDHCHTTGMIRGLLCGRCNGALGVAENGGLFAFYSTPGYLYDPAVLSQLQREMGVTFLWDSDTWLDRNRGILLLYMQRDRWLPRKDILFHLKARSS